MRTISALLAETGDIFEGIRPEFSTSLPQAGDSIVIYCRETRQYYDGVVTGADWYAYAVLVGEKRSGRFKRETRKQRNTPPLGTLRGLSNAQRGEETARHIMEILRERGEKVSTDEIALTLGKARTTVSLHLRNGLADQVKRSVGPNRCAMWEAAA